MAHEPRWVHLEQQSWAKFANKIPGREEEARATLIRLRRVPADDHRIELELLEIKAATIFDQETETARFPNTKTKFQLNVAQYKELFIVRHLNLRLLIACLLQVIQQLTGINLISE